MSSSTLIRMSGLAAMLAGLSFALFVLIHPFGEWTTAQVSQADSWFLAHLMHMLGGVFALFGLIGLYAQQREDAGLMGLIGFIVAFAGTALVVGVGLFVAFVWPVLAAQAPALFEVTGPIFSAPPVIFIVTFALFGAGYVLFGLATLKADVLPRWGALSMMLGAVLFTIPPEPFTPVPWAVFVAGGILLGAGLGWLGYAVWIGVGEVSRGALPAA